MIAWPRFTEMPPPLSEVAVSTSLKMENPSMRTISVSLVRVISTTEFGVTLAV